MTIENMKFGGVKLTIATTLTLLLSVAQSEPAEAMPSFYGMGNVRANNVGFDAGNTFQGRHFAADEPGFLAGSNAGMVFSRADDHGEMSVVAMQRNQTTRMHFNFQSNLTDAGFSATLVTHGTPQIEGANGATGLDLLSTEDLGGASPGVNYSLTFDLPAGQILLENDLISIITATDFAQFIPSQLSASELANTHFAALLNSALQGSDMAGFSLSMAESLAESELLQYQFLGDQYAKGDDQYTEGGWACAGALIALAVANAALAAAIYVTYVTLGAAFKSIAAAVSAIAVAMVMVDQYCLQK